MSSATTATIAGILAVIFGGPTIKAILDALDRRTERKRADAAEPDPELRELTERNGQLAEALRYDESRIAQLQEDLDEKTIRLRAEEERNDHLREQLLEQREQTETLKLKIAELAHKIQQLTEEVAQLRGIDPRG